MNPNFTSAEFAAQKLREAILSGELRPGSKIHQNQIAEVLGVSRTPLRTALTMLMESNLVVYESNKGFKVREFSFEHIQQAFVIRAELEGLACQLAANNMTDERAEQLYKLTQEGDQLLINETLLPEHQSAYRQMNVSFHTYILEYSQNSLLGEMIDRIHNVPLISDRVIIWQNRDVFLRTHDDHHRIALALANGDGQRAQNLMREHVTFSIEYMLKMLKESKDLSSINLNSLGL